LADKGNNKEGLHKQHVKDKNWSEWSACGSGQHLGGHYFRYLSSSSSFLLGDVVQKSHTSDMTSEGLGEMFEGDSGVDGGQSEDPGAMTPIGAIVNYIV
jgi:hypothetical protein